MKKVIPVRLRYYVLAFMAVCLSACSHEEMTPNPEFDGHKDVTETTGRRFNATFYGKFVPEREFGLYMKVTDVALSSVGNIYDNVRLFKNEDHYASDRDLIWPEGNTTYDFIAYSPYTPSIEEISSVPVSVSTNQSTRNEYEASDCLWGIAKNVAPDVAGPSVNLQHIMSQVNIKIDIPDLNYEKLTVRLSNTCPSGFVNIADGTVNPYGKKDDITCLNMYDGTFSAILIPQTLTYTHFITINYDGIEYVYHGSIDLKPTVTHTLTIKSLSDNEIKLTVNVQDWNLAEEIEDNCEEER